MAKIKLPFALDRNGTTPVTDADAIDITVDGETKNLGDVVRQGGGASSAVKVSFDPDSTPFDGETVQAVIEEIGDGVALCTDEPGTDGTIDGQLQRHQNDGLHAINPKTKAANVSFEKGSTGMSAETTQAAIEELAEENKKNAAITSTETADLDIADEEGNVIVRFKDGNIKTKIFNANATNSNVGLNNYSQFSNTKDYIIGNICFYNGFLYKFVETHAAGEWIGTDAELTSIKEIIGEHPVKTNYDADSNFDISDENGNVIARFNNGNIKTKNFDSSGVNNDIALLKSEVASIGGVGSKPKAVIIDTDWWTDIDDAMDFVIALWAERTGLIDIVGVCIDAVDQYSAKSLSRYLNYQGRKGLCIGLDKQATDYDRYGNPYQVTVIDNWDITDYNSNDECEDCVAFYRRALTSLPTDEKCDIIGNGYLNAFERLLKSEADEYSELNGIELVKQKVNKFYIMAGEYPSGTENNFSRTERSREAGYYFCQNCPVEVVFSGYSIGGSVYIGDTIKDCLGSNDLLYKMMQTFGSDSRQAWGSMNTLLGCVGDAQNSGYSLTRGTVNVNTTDGSNTFTQSDDGLHYYTTKNYDDNFYKYQLNQILEKHAWPFRQLGRVQISKI